MSRLRGGVALALGALLGAALPLSSGGQVLGDIVLDRIASRSNEAPVVFPHWKHRVRFKCYACHPDPFEMRAGANEITMDKLRAGQYCARCHDGSVAFPVAFETCRTCHSLQTTVTGR